MTSGVSSEPSDDFKEGSDAKASRDTAARNCVILRFECDDRELIKARQAMGEKDNIGSVEC